jgi:hypothetical protein
MFKVSATFHRSDAERPDYLAIRPTRFGRKTPWPSGHPRPIPSTRTKKERAS